jgi:hypothetical protein
MAKMDRRFFLALGAASLILARSRARAADSSTLSARDLAAKLSDQSFVDETLGAFDALASALLLVTGPDPAIDEWDKYGTYRQQFADDANRRSVAQRIQSDGTLERKVDDAAEQIKSVALTLSNVLEQNGIRADSPLGKRLVSSFVTMHQFFIASGNDDAWYCSIYMFRLLC